MKTYTGDAGFCSKCHNKLISTAYVKDLFGEEEYIERICRRCGYCWYEKPLDDKGEKDASG